MKKKHLTFIFINLFLSFFLTNCSQQNDTKLDEDIYNEEIDDGNTATLKQPSQTLDCSRKFEVKENGEDIYLGNIPCPYWEKKFDEFLNDIKIDEDPKTQKLQEIARNTFLEPYVKKIYGFSSLEEAKEDYAKYNEKRDVITRSLDKFSKESKTNKGNNQINNWTTSDKKNFKEDCLRGLVDANSQLSLSSRNEYCDCVLEKIILKYPDKYSTQDLNWLKTTAKECVVELVNKH